MKPRSWSFNRSIISTLQEQFKQEKVSLHYSYSISFELIGCDISCDSQSEYRFSIWDELNIHQIVKAHQLSSEEVLKETLRQHFFLGFKVKTCLKIFNFKWFSKNCPVSQVFVMSSNMDNGSYMVVIISEAVYKCTNKDYLPEA